MFFIVYDWKENKFRFKAGQQLTSFRGVAEFATLDEWRDHLWNYGLRTGRKVNASTWRVERVE